MGKLIVMIKSNGKDVLTCFIRLPSYITPILRKWPNCRNAPLEMRNGLNEPWQIIKLSILLILNYLFTVRYELCCKLIPGSQHFAEKLQFQEVQYKAVAC